MKRLFRILTWSVGIITILLTLYVVFNGLGLVDGLDFGAGAYYYADIPDFDKYMHDNAFVPFLPLWVYILLFIGWGYLMWRLWVWVEHRRL